MNTPRAQLEHAMRAACVNMAVLSRLLSQRFWAAISAVTSVSSDCPGGVVVPSTLQHQFPTGFPASAMIASCGCPEPSVVPKKRAVGLVVRRRGASAAGYLRRATTRKLMRRQLSGKYWKESATCTATVWLGSQRGPGPMRRGVALASTYSMYSTLSFIAPMIGSLPQ